jgi:DNA adenine methylase
MPIPELVAPFPYFGGKRTVAEVVWQRLGDVPNYVEPFFGSGAVLLARPGKPGIETVNDADGMVANFWRAVRAAPDEVAEYADWPVNENDLHARHAWLVGQKESLASRLEGDPDYYDAKIAGWWCWGMSCWIGSGFTSGGGPWQVVDGQLVKVDSDSGGRDASWGINRKRVHLGLGTGIHRQRVNLVKQGINRKLVHLGGGQGINRQRMHLGDAGEGVHAPTAPDIYNWMRALAQRLRRVRVCCGDWSRVCGPSVTFNHDLTGVFLDPPYAHSEREADLYTVDTDVSASVREWAVENGKNPLMRIALCGYEGEHDMPPDWTVYKWKTGGGYGNIGQGRGAENRFRERIWFSPACLPPLQPSLFEF